MFFLLVGCVAEAPKDVKLVSVVSANMDEASNFSPHGRLFYWGVLVGDGAEGDRGAYDW